ncbi:MAG: hypothetical protein ACI8XB_003086 [Patiriisocius sp.]|jgi:hypothetical protein
MKIFLTLVGLSIIVASCDKKKLEGDSEILIGKWNWTHSYRNVDVCSPPGDFIEINPSTEGHDYSIAFLQKGKVIFYEDNEEIESFNFKLTFSNNTSSNPNYLYAYAIHFGGGKVLNGSVGLDSLYDNRYFPYEDSQCEDYYGYFVRE